MLQISYFTNGDDSVRCFAMLFIHIGTILSFVYTSCVFLYVLNTFTHGERGRERERAVHFLQIVFSLLSLFISSLFEFCRLTRRQRSILTKCFNSQHLYNTHTHSHCLLLCIDGNSVLWYCSNRNPMLELYKNKMYRIADFGWCLKQQLLLIQVNQHRYKWSKEMRANGHLPSWFSIGTICNFV